MRALIAASVHQHLADVGLCRSAVGRGPADPIRLQAPVVAALHQGRLLARVARLRGELVPARAHAARVLLPRHGRTRGSDRHGGQDGRDGLHPAPARQGARGRHGPVRRHGPQLARPHHPVHLRRGRDGRRRVRGAAVGPARPQRRRLSADVLHRHDRPGRALPRGRPPGRRRLVVARAPARARRRVPPARGRPGHPPHVHLRGQQPQGLPAGQDPPHRPERAADLPHRPPQAVRPAAGRDRPRRRRAVRAPARRPRRRRDQPAGAAERHSALPHPPALQLCGPARARGGSPQPRGVRVGAGRGRASVQPGVGQPGRDVRHPRRPVDRRAGDADDAQHVPLRASALQAELG